MRHKTLIQIVLAIFLPTSGISAQSLRPNYVELGIRGSSFPAQLQTWEKGTKWTEDDNFFISRVKPKKRFRNTATQVNPSLDESEDKNLIFWMPIGNSDYNALPDGIFDREVFPMWAYITHFGNWSAPLVRIPGGLADVAHKNGVPISALATTPLGTLSEAWNEALQTLHRTGAEKFADYLLYYGVDGIGYNSEFNCGSALVTNLGKLHAKTRSIMHERGNHLAEFIWYDGTNGSGSVTYDMGLGTHNQSIWGYGENIRSSLFFNYNWNSDLLLSQSVEKAKKLGRTPLDLYCGVNLQGREPQEKWGDIWPMLAKYPLSIGLWGAHTRNMFFESRYERGASPEDCQRTYLTRMERWFTGGSRNPVNTPDLNNSLVYSADNVDFGGMSKMMSARSALSWNLSEEPFITYFNLGNGRFFNYKGKRQHDSEWYNISMQDYLPTWMWWFTTNFMGRERSDVPTSGLDARFIWDDAWMGGSCLQIRGTIDEEYLHLFKTEFSLENGDEITFRYKLIEGSSDISLILSTKGNENSQLSGTGLTLLENTNNITGHWIEKKLVVGRDVKVPESELAMIALRFNNSNSLDLRLGEISIIRHKDMKGIVPTPRIEKSEILCARHDGVDGKIIFTMPNDKNPDVCYNIDVNTSMFKLYCQQENQKPTLMGMTTSWAGLIFSAPYETDGIGKIRFGVSALGLDHIIESEIGWGDWHDISEKYEISDAIDFPSSNIHPGEAFSIKYLDSTHEKGTWYIIDSNSNIVASSNESTYITLEKGLPQQGCYDVRLIGYETIEGQLKETDRTFKGSINVVEDMLGSSPRILSVSSSDANSENLLDSGVLRICVEEDEAIISYNAETSNTEVSRGVKVGKKVFGFPSSEAGINADKSFSVGFWIKLQSFENNAIHLFSIRDKGDKWTFNNWGWFWHTLNTEGASDAFTVRMENGKNLSLKFGELRFTPEAWYHLVYVFDINEKGEVLPSLYVNGEKATVTSWSIGEEKMDGDTYAVGPSFAWREDNMIAVGGPLHTAGSVNGTLDDFQVWDKALTDQEVRTSFYGNTQDKMNSIIGSFDFEQSPDADGKFPNNGSKTFKAGSFVYLDTEMEGQGIPSWKESDLTIGSPFSKGTSHKVITSARWEAPACLISNQFDIKEGGSVKISVADKALGSVYSEGYPVRLTLTNDYGQDIKDLLLQFSSTATSMIEDTAAFRVTPTIFNSEIGVVCQESGEITISLFTLSGQRVLCNTFSSSEGEIMKIYPEVARGIYMLNVTNGETNLGTRKIIRR